MARKDTLISMSEACPEPPRRTKRRRTNDGCRPCRIRKKKCDGRRPSCVSCERNVLLCSWFPSITGSKDDVVGAGKDGSREGVRSEVDQNSPSLRPRIPSSSPCDDEQRSHMGDGIVCKKPSSPPVFLSLELVMSVPALCQEPFLEPIFRSPTSTLLYQHWIERTGDMVAAKRGRLNAFVTELPRLAIAYPDTVMHSILATSGIHYCNGNKSLEVETSTWTHLGLALRSLKHGLTKLVSPTGNDPVPLLATALVMCFLENTRGDVNGNMGHHLRAADRLFNSAVAAQSLQMEDSILEFLKEFYIYITRITDISYNSERLPSEAGVSSDANSPASWISPKSHGMLVGCSYELFNMIQPVSALARRKRERLRKRETTDQNEIDDLGQELEQDRAAYQAMRKQVLAWQPPSNVQQDFITCGAIYQQAVLCYLDVSFADPASLSQPQLPNFVQKPFDVLQQLLEVLPLDAYISSTLCWPLALFGSLAKYEAQRNLIYNRLQAMWDVLRIGNIKATMQFLERLWDDLRSGEIVLVGSSVAAQMTTLSARGRNKTPVDLTDMEGLMRRYNLLLSFA